MIERTVFSMKPSKLAFLLPIVLLAGCASSDPDVKDIPGTVITFSDGKPAYFITCDNYSAFSACVRRSAEICPQGYTTLASRHDEFGSAPIWDIHKNMTIRCNTSDDMSLGNQNLPPNE